MNEPTCKSQADTNNIYTNINESGVTVADWIKRSSF